LHTQLPFTHACPEAQGALVPHWQVPLLQLLLVTGLHTVHAAPSLPQVCSPGALQVLPVQQPPSQLAAQSGQTPPAHPGVGEQAVHEAPAVPHCESVLPGRQLVPSQQPLGQVVESQRQAPLTQVWPVWHSAPAPQRHTPSSQRSEATVSQAEQLPPPVPQRLMPFTTHTPLAQQPLGQLAASQTSCWLTFTTTVVSLPSRASPSAEPEPTTTALASASTFTVTVPAYAWGRARRTDCSRANGVEAAGSGRSVGPSVASPAFSTTNESWSTGGSAGSRFTCTKMVGALELQPQAVNATQSAAMRIRSEVGARMCV
jgi:hypothetical protein